MGLDWIRQPHAIKKSPNHLAEMTCYYRNVSDAILRNGATFAHANRLQLHLAERTPRWQPGVKFQTTNYNRVLSRKGRPVHEIILEYHFFPERRAHAPLGARAEVSHGVKVVITVNHVNRTAPSGCVARLVLQRVYIWMSARINYCSEGASAKSSIRLHL